MLLSAILHGAPFVLMSYTIPVIFSVLGPPSPPPGLEASFTALLEASAVWAHWAQWLACVGWGMGVSTALLSTVCQYRTIVVATSQKPVTVQDHFALAAEHDPVIGFANHVLQSVDRAIANQWPSKPKNR